MMMLSYNYGYESQMRTSNKTKYVSCIFEVTDRIMTMELDGLTGFRTIRPVYVTRRDAKDGRIFLTSREANIYSCGRTIDEAKKEFSEILDFAWNEYVLCDENELHESAIPYKKWLMEHFEKVDHDNQKD